MAVKNDTSGSNVSDPAETTNSSAPISNGTNFMSLPVEIRNDIYALTLTHNKPLCVTRRGSHLREIVHRPNGKRLEKVYKLGCKIVELEHGIRVTVSAKEALSVALLETTKTINEEALPVLLGGNHFTFERAVGLHAFCDALGEKAKLLANLTVKEAVLSENAKEQLCILSRIEHPKTIFITPQTRDHGGHQVLCPSATWEMIKPIVWRSEWAIKRRMSFRPEESIETQRARIEAFRFNMSKFKAIAVASGKVEVIESGFERAQRFVELITDRWWEEAKVTGVRRKREEGGSFADLPGSKQARFA